MPRPSPLSIAISSLNRLIKEEASYHAEQQQQEATIAKLEAEAESTDATKEDEDEEGNRAFTLGQQPLQSTASANTQTHRLTSRPYLEKALTETKAVFPLLHERIASAKENLEGLIEQHASAQETDDKDLQRARQLLDQVGTMELRAQ